MTVCIFFWIDGPFIFLDALVKSYAVLPPDMLPSPALLHLDSSFMKVVLGFLAYLTAISCQLAAPALIMILMSNVFLGIMNRLAPQVQITFLGLSLNAYLGDLALWAAWYFIIDRLGVEALKWMQNLTSLLESVVLAQ
jgi:type III secretion protein T